MGKKKKRTTVKDLEKCLKEKDKRIKELEAWRKWKTRAWKSVIYLAFISIIMIGSFYYTIFIDIDKVKEVLVVVGAGSLILVVCVVSFVILILIWDDEEEEEEEGEWNPTIN